MRPSMKGVQASLMDFFTTGAATASLTFTVT